ncbi:hypothetical protein NPIL_74361 [Nephila pilipes]|uniref:Uncharacterized protein n=1 Tax=Nephila pilipes TaxID=299642 RepID=A0A8X6PQW7_NEPPI|nr:hypothetical protein NPIL_74361 [Nephila pilipes]
MHPRGVFSDTRILRCIFKGCGEDENQGCVGRTIDTKRECGRISDWFRLAVIERNGGRGTFSHSYKGVHGFGKLIVSEKIRCLRRGYINLFGT